MTCALQNFIKGSRRSLNCHLAIFEYSKMILSIILSRWQFCCKSLGKTIFLQTPIYARAIDLEHLLDLKEAGATDAILENAEVLNIYNFSFSQIRKLSTMFAWRSDQKTIY